MGALLQHIEIGEEVQLEYRSLKDVDLPILSFDMMQHAVHFITACLNSRCKGTICFGVVGREDGATVSQVVGVPVKKNLMRLIETAFANMLDNHIETEKLSKLDERQRPFIKMYPIKVTDLERHTNPSMDVQLVRPDDQRYVFEIDVDPQLDTLAKHYYFYWWFSQPYYKLLDVKAYGAYQDSDRFKRDQANKVLVERRDGRTNVRPATEAALLRDEVKQKYQRFKQIEEKCRKSLGSNLC